LFGLRRIIKGETLGGFGWRPCKDKAEEDGPYGLTMGEHGRTKVVLMTCDFKYINHSKKPNVCLHTDYTVVALRDINCGDEIVSDYGNWAPDDPS